MLCEITPLRKAGVRLARCQWPAPLRGVLEIADWDAGGNNFKRNVRQAQFWEVHPTAKRPLIQSIFDPVILRTVDGGFLLSGIELQSLTESQQVAEHIQIWLCRPVAAG